MEQLKDTMSRIQELQTSSEHGSEPKDEREYEQRKADSYNASVGKLNEEDGYECAICKNKGYVATVYQSEMFGYYSETLVPCKCQKVRKTIRRLNRSGLKNMVKDYTFDKYTVDEPWQKKIKDSALKFVQDPANHWFYIGGQSGAGKTHICTAIAVAYLKRGKEMRYMLWRDEITKIKAVVNDPQQYGEIMKGLKEAPVLYIDDLFKSGKARDENGQHKPQHPTAADVNVAFEIINFRYNNPELVTIISSERSISDLNEIDEAVAGRIAERTKPAGYCLNLRKDPTRNWRMKGLDEI